MRALPELHRQALPSGVELAWWDWPAEDESSAEETVLLVHATGFHARCWDAVVERLGNRRVIALDMRGHGLSEKTEPVRWDRFGDDLLEFVQELGLGELVGVGHSMGGFCMTWAAAQCDAFKRLVLVDPVILPPELYAARGQWSEGAEHPTAKRRNQWRDWEEMFERFEDRMPFANWERRVLEDYCRHGVMPAPEGGGFVLACPPTIEASIYMGSSDRDIHGLVPAVDVPVTVVRAKSRGADRDVMDFSSSPTDPNLARGFPQGRDVHLPEHSHFLPMEAPALAAELILGTR